MAAMAPACAKKTPPPLPFVKSSAFAQIVPNTLRLLRADLDGNGVDEAIAAQRVGPGIAVSVYGRQLAGETYVWERQCTGPVVEGPELDLMRMVEMGGGSLLLVVASDATPDTVTQWFALVDLPASCKSRRHERVRLRVPGDTIAPGMVPGGVSVPGDQPGVRIVDDPEILRLDGSESQVEVLMSVRERRLVGTPAKVQAIEGRRRFIRPRRLTVSWVAAASRSAVVAPEPVDALTGEPSPTQLPELVDGNDKAAFVVRAGESGTLFLVGDASLALVELHHGCHGREPVPLTLRQGGRTYVTGQRPERQSFVRAAGRGHRPVDGRWRDLLALWSRSRAIALDLEGAADERCLREIRAYGLGDPEPAQEPTRAP